MSELGTLWDSLQADEPVKTSRADLDPIPTGFYECYIDRASFDESSKPYKASIWFKIEEGEFAGRVLFGNYILSEKGITFFKQDMQKLGYSATPKSTVDLVNAVHNLSGTKCTVKAIQRQYVSRTGETKFAHNIYVQKAMSNDTVLAVKPGKDDLPF